MLNKNAFTYGSVNNPEMDYIHNKIREISNRPEEIAKSIALKKHFSKPETYRDWLHDSNTWARRTMQKVPGAIPYAIGGAYDLFANGVDAIPNYANLAWKSMLGKGNQWRDKKYLRTDNNWGYKVGDWLTDNVGKPVEQFINPVGNAISGLTSDNKQHYGDNLSLWQQLFGRPWSEKPQYSQALQKADPLNVMGMLEDAGADAAFGAILGEKLLRHAGNFVHAGVDFNKAQKWYKNQDKAIALHAQNKYDKYTAPIRKHLSELLDNENRVALRNSVLDTEYARYGGETGGWLKRKGAEIRRNMLAKKLNSKDKLYQFITDNPQYLDKGWNRGTLNKIHPEEIWRQTDNLNSFKDDMFTLKTLTSDYQGAPRPPMIKKLKTILKEYGPEPLFKGSYHDIPELLTATRNEGERLWFSPLPEVSLGYGHNLGIFNVPDDMQDVVRKLRTPHVAGSVKSDDLISGRIRGEDLAQRAGASNIGQSPDYEVALPPDLLGKLTTTRNKAGGANYNIYQQIKPVDLTPELSVLRRVTDPIPERILNIPLYTPAPMYERWLRTYGGKIPFTRYTSSTMVRPKVFNFSPYPQLSTDKMVGTKYSPSINKAMIPMAVQENNR